MSQANFGKVDVAISVYGKPYHTAVAILSLMKHSGQHIDKIYFNEQKTHPHGDSIAFIKPWLGDNIVYFTPSINIGMCKIDRLNIEEYRLSVRYQHAWENTDKNYLFVMHNDCLFTGDIIGGMLEKIQGNLCAGVGLIGQCWNCPAWTAKLCDSTRHDVYKPSYEEAIKIVQQYKSPRTTIERINIDSPMPFPECRLNEFACLLHVERLRDIVYPKGDVVPFGVTRLDLGTEWFRSLVLRGYKFENWFERVKHAWVQGAAGKPSNTDRLQYEMIESIAKKYLAQNFSISI